MRGTWDWFQGDGLNRHLGDGRNPHEIGSFICHLGGGFCCAVTFDSRAPVVRLKHSMRKRL